MSRLTAARTTAATSTVPQIATATWLRSRIAFIVGSPADRGVDVRAADPAVRQGERELGAGKACQVAEAAANAERAQQLVHRAAQAGQDAAGEIAQCTEHLVDRDVD